jgi:hypothetical protein
MRPSRSDRLNFGPPSISRERIWCTRCREPTLRKWNACVHCGEISDLSSKKSLPTISKRFGHEQAQKRPHDPVTGQFVGKTIRRKVAETV